MDKVRVDRFRQRLDGRAAELRAALEKPPDQTPAVAPDAAIGRLTRVDAQQAGYVSEALRRQTAAELASVQRARTRIDAGTFGVCPRCEDDLSDARLEARPDAVLCVSCAERG